MCARPINSEDHVFSGMLHYYVVYSYRIFLIESIQQFVLAMEDLAGNGHSLGVDGTLQLS